MMKAVSVKGAAWMRRVDAVASIKPEKLSQIKLHHRRIPMMV